MNQLRKVSTLKKWVRKKLNYLAHHLREATLHLNHQKKKMMKKNTKKILMKWKKRRPLVKQSVLISPNF